MRLTLRSKIYDELLTCSLTVANCRILERDFMDLLTSVQTAAWDWCCAIYLSLFHRHCCNPQNDCNHWLLWFTAKPLIKAKATTRCIHCLSEEHTTEHCSYISLWPITPAVTRCQYQLELAASLYSKPTPSYQAQSSYPTTCKLCGHLHPKANCPIWTSNSGKCPSPFPYQPFSKHAKHQ